MKWPVCRLRAADWATETHGIFAPTRWSAALAGGSLSDPDTDCVVNAWDAYHGLIPLQADGTIAGMLAPSAAVLPGNFVFNWQEAIDPLGLTVALPMTGEANVFTRLALEIP